MGGSCGALPSTASLLSSTDINHHMGKHVEGACVCVCGFCMMPSHLTNTQKHSISPSSTSLLLLLLFLHIHSACVCVFLVSPAAQRSWFLSSLPVQPVMTERGMLLVLYRPLKITHPLTAMYGPTDSLLQPIATESSSHSLGLSASLIGRQ